jgi:hypothetical protein
MRDGKSKMPVKRMVINVCLKHLVYSFDIDRSNSWCLPASSRRHVCGCSNVDLKLWYRTDVK